MGTDDPAIAALVERAQQHTSGVIRQGTNVVDIGEDKLVVDKTTILALHKRMEDAEARVQYLEECEREGKKLLVREQAKVQELEKEKHDYWVKILELGAQSRTLAERLAALEEENRGLKEGNAAIKKFVESQVDLDETAKKALYENRWDLYDEGIINKEETLP